MTRAARLPSTIVAIAALTAVASGSAQSRDLPWGVVGTTVVGRAQAFGSIVSADLASDGSVYVIDNLNQTLTRFDPQGRALWQVGGKGRGPGEFLQAYRVAARPEGGAVVYDAYIGELTWFGPTGRYENRAVLGVRFAQVDNVVVLASGELVVAGSVRELTGAPEAAIKSALHVFGRDLSYLRSFGPLPDARDPAVLRFWGAGFATRADDGTLFFTRKLPYEVYQFSAEGALKARTGVATHVVARPDDFMRFSESPNAAGNKVSRYTLSPTAVPVPARVVPVGRRYLITGLIGRGKRTIDVLDGLSRALIASVDMPSSWFSVFGYDSARSVLWVIGEVNDEPVLIRQQIVVRGNDPSRGGFP